MHAMKDTNAHHVVVLGATHKSHRYANQAIRRLVNAGHRVTPINPRLDSAEGLPVTATLAEVNDPVDTLTLYVGPARLEGMIDAILALRPGRVIFNPGTESRHLQNALDRAGIPWLEACTLVMLSVGNFLDD